RCPVQLGTAVNRNPAIEAVTKPKTISCACHMVGGQDIDSDQPNPQINTHKGTRSAAAIPAARKVGRKPLANNLDCMTAPVPAEGILGATLGICVVVYTYGEGNAVSNYAP